MAGNDVRISSAVTEKLKGRQDSVFLLGWVEGNEILCSGCARAKHWNDNDKPEDFRRSLDELIALFPEGIRIVGLYEHCAEDQADQRSKQQLGRLLHFELENVITDSRLVFIHPLESEDKVHEDAHLKALIFDAKLEKSFPGTLTIEDSLYENSNSLCFRVRGNVPLSFESSSDSNELRSNVEKAFNAVESKISTLSVYHLQKSDILISNSEKSYVHSQLNENSKCGDLIAFICDTNDNSDIYLKKSKKKASKSIKYLFLKLMIQATGEEAIKQTFSCAPVIRYERRNFINVTLPLHLDTLVILSSSVPLQQLPSILNNAIRKQLFAMQDVILNFYREKKKFLVPKVYHFSSPSCSHLLSIIYPLQLSDMELEPRRRELHDLLLLPLDRPFLRKSMTYRFPDEDSSNGYLSNVHIGLPSSGVKDGQVALVQGTYTYHHYMQDHFDDSGWGCAYRSLQTVVSWFVNQGYANCNIPTHQEIQQALVDIGDKQQSFVKSKKWIGSLEVSYCLNKLIGVESKIMSVSSGADLVSKGRELVNHFQSHGSPIMIGGGVLAHTILGVHANFQTGDIKFLVLDPHYTGAEDLSVIQGKGWCGWKGPAFWDKTAYYNLCCPLRPPGI